MAEKKYLKLKDRFSNHSEQYAVFRPTYPEALYDFILSLVKEKNNAWDCGCGNGQVASDLSEKFKRVIATDISEKQIANAIVKENIFYAVSASEKTDFKNSTFDLITVGQALHWFDIPTFFDEVKRVGKPEGIVAVWGYGLLKITPDIDTLIQHFYTDVVGSYWDKERKLVDEHYRHIQFPFKEIPSPGFDFSFQWTQAQLHGYLSTWSSVQKYISEHKINPVDALMNSIDSHWSDEEMKVTFPLFLRVGEIK
jgi:ubiquinone/menaquinone biosynthesis C-methylase UbiE